MKKDKKYKIAIETLMELNETDILRDSERDAVEEVIYLLQDIRYADYYNNKRTEWFRKVMK